MECKRWRSRGACLSPRAGGRGPGAARAAASAGVRSAFRPQPKPLFGFRQWLTPRKSALASRVLPPLVARANPFARYRPSTWRDTPRAPLPVRVSWVGTESGQEAWRELARAHRLRGTGRRTEDRGEHGRREYERGAGARHGDAYRGSCHVVCRWKGWPRRVRVGWLCVAVAWSCRQM